MKLAWTCRQLHDFCALGFCVAFGVKQEKECPSFLEFFHISTSKGSRQYINMYKYRCIINVFYTDIDHQKKKQQRCMPQERQDEKGGPPYPIIKVTSLEDPNDNTVIL